MLSSARTRRNRRRGGPLAANAAKKRQAGSAIVGHMLDSTESRAVPWQSLFQAVHATCNSARLEFLQCAIHAVVHTLRDMR